MIALTFDSPQFITLCRQNDIARVRVFGSASRGEATEKSDVDLLVEFAQQKSLLTLVRLEREMSNALGRRVDLLTEGSISPYIRERIEPDLRVVYEQAR